MVTDTMEYYSVETQNELLVTQNNMNLKNIYLKWKTHRSILLRFHLYEVQANINL